MTPPKKVRVGPHVFTVRVDPDLAREENLVGLCSEDIQDIRIAHYLAPSTERETVLHELFHAIWHQTALSKKVTNEEEEEAIWSLSPRILALLLDNPALVRYLTSKE